jgi:predicted AAA+ superfamily ATPase
MAVSNLERVGRGLDILKTGLAPYVLRELKGQYKTRWWKDGVESALRGNIGREAASATLTDDDRFERLDIQALLVILWENWNAVFENPLGRIARSYVSEIREVRNKWAHQQPFTADDAFRAIDTMARLLEMIGAPQQEELKKLAREMLRQRYEADTQRELKKGGDVTQTGTLPGLKPWREVATPHPDVASGRYQQAEFAADLYQVITDQAEAEYGDPLEFFHRTFLTEGLTRLLSRAWLRLAGSGGDPVVELQTNFGGGKTHSMLALYHLFGGGLAPKDVPGIETLIPQEFKSKPTNLPCARRAVLVGTQLSPAEIRTKPDGTQIRTLWGEMAWQLGQAAGKASEAYALVADEDRLGVSPGSEKLTALLTRYSPALILIDEWVAFARQLYGKEGLPAGSFDANITFVQALTEAAKAARNALLVAALPVSPRVSDHNGEREWAHQDEIEIGGEGGRAALVRLQNVFGRLEAVWKPATSTESFEIVRRRLFQPIAEYAARDATCRAFSEMYQANRAEFPGECREAAYEGRLRSAYPIHPELFDRLYEDWSTLERFQRTRGVLRIMAAIIHELWEREDRSLLIQPGTIPLDNAAVRFEATRYLPEGWGAVLDRDVDGSTSRPLNLDAGNPNLGRYSACRRVARAIFVGSAPSVTEQRTRGIEEVRIKLGCVQPGETIAVFGDALHRLSDDLTYLYAGDSRYWYDTRPTITRIASDRAGQFKSETVEDEIVRRVRSAIGREKGDLAGVHPIPPSSGDVPDEAECRLVVLGPKTPHRTRNGGSKAQAAATEMLDRRGNGPRGYRNMLVFLAPDSERLLELEQAVRSWLAWTSIQQEKEQLNLDAAQERQAKTQATKADETIAARIGETFSLLLTPSQEGNNPVEWTYSRLQGSDNLVVRASKKLKRDGQLIAEWSPANLRIELDKWLWREQNHLSVKQLWEYLATYLYLPRLKDEHVLVAAIREGVGSLTWQDYFAYAASVREDGRYIGLTAGQVPHVTLDNQSVLVKPQVAAEQIAADAAAAAGATTPGGVEYGAPAATYQAGTAQNGKALPPPPVAPLVAETRPTRFQGSVRLDPTRVSRDAGKIAEEVVQHLTGLMDAKVEVTLEIHAELPEGAPDHVVRTVTENCRTLKFTTQGFETD